MICCNASEPEVGHTNDGEESASNVALASVLSSLSAHEVFSYNHLSELVSFESEQGHLVEHREHKATCANDENSVSDGEPNHLVHEEGIEVFHKLEENANDSKSNHVLDQDALEGELDLDVSSESVINELNLLVGIVDFIASNQPL